MLESNPPDKKVQIGLSETSWLVIESFKKYFIFSQVFPKLSVCSLDFKLQYLVRCKPDLLNTPKWAGFSSKIFLKTVVPEVWLGPIPNNSLIPWESIIFSTPGNLKMALISDANIKVLFCIV